MNIVITGVTRGLGRSLAEACMAAGHRVIGCGRSGSEIFGLRLEFPECHFSVVDVALDNKVGLWAVDVLESFGAPDVLINNAALMNRPGPLWEQDDAEFTRLVDVNLRGVQNVIRHFVPAMVAVKRGVIINLSSGWGRSVSADVAPYCMSKWGVEGLTKALAEELPDGMAAVALNPGVIDTDMLRLAWGNEASGHESPEDWARRAMPYILALGAKANGQSLSVPT